MKIHPGHRRFDDATNAPLMRELLQGPLGERAGFANIDDLWVTRVSPGAEGGFTIQYVVVRGGEKRTICGRLLGNNEPTPGFITQWSERVIWIEAIGLALPLFPFDPTLESLAEVASPDGAARLLNLVGEAHGPAITPVVLGYRLEKRCVLLLDGEIPVVAKVVRRKKLSGIVSSHEHLAKNGFAPSAEDGVTVPRVLHVDEGRSFFLMTKAPGRSLHDLAGDATFADGCLTAAAVLNKLSTVNAHGLPPYTPSDEVKQLGDWVARVGSLFPDEEKRFAGCFSRIASRQVDPHGDRLACIHRDFYDKQLFFAPGTATLLDCDNLARGDAAQDYGNFVAHTELRALQHPEHSDMIKHGAKLFADAFRPTDGHFDARARWWRGSTLLRLAALYSLRPRWRHLTETLIEKAESWV